MLLLNRLRGPVRNLLNHDVTGDLAALYLAHIVRYLLPLITVPYLARVLGVGSWGTVAFIQAYTALLAQVVEFGFGLSGTRDVARHRNSSVDSSRILGAVLAAQFFLSAGVIGLTGFSIGLIPIFREQSFALWLGVGAAVAQGIRPLWFFRGLQRMRIVAVLEVLAKVVYLIVLLLVVRSPSDTWKVFAAAFAGSLLATLVALGLAYHSRVFRVPGARAVVATLHGGAVLFLVRVGATFFTEGNVFILGLFASPTHVGYFSGALRIITAVRGLLSPAVDVLFPRLSYLVAHAPQAAVTTIRRVLVAMSLIGVSLTTFTFVAAPLLVNTILGQGFGPATDTLRILSLLPLVIAINHVLGSHWMVPCGLDRYFSGIVVGVAGINAALAAAVASVAPEHGHIAVSWVIVAAQLLLNVSYYVVLRVKNLDPFLGNMQRNDERPR